MAQAAYCSRCGTNVYVTPDGQCPQGHGPESLSNYYQTDAEGDAPAPQPIVSPGVPGATGGPPKKSKTGLIIGIVLALLLLCGVGTGVTMCSILNAAEDSITTFEDSFEITDDPATDLDDPATDLDDPATDLDDPATQPGEADESGMGPDTTPPLQDGVVRVVLGWDEASDLDLEIWNSAGDTLEVRALTEYGMDVTNGTQGREYFDFTGSYGSGEYVVSVYFADNTDAPDSANAKLLVFGPDGSTTSRTKEIRWDPGQDQWHAFRIDAATGAIEDIDRFIDVEMEE